MAIESNATFVPHKFLCIANVAIQGVYNKQNIRNTMAVLELKNTALNGLVSELESKSIPTPFKIPIVETTISFATKPDIRLATIPQLKIPSGIKTGSNIEEIFFNKLWLISVVNLKLYVKCCNNQIKQLKTRITEPALTKKSIAVFMLFNITFFSDGTRSAGNSNIKVSCVGLILLYITAWIVKTTTPSAYNPKITNIFLTPKKAEPIIV